MALKVTKKLYAQCQIYTTEPGMQCPLFGRDVEPGLGHYCTVRNGQVLIEGQLPPRKEGT